MTLRELLEAEWERHGVRSPGHLVAWSNAPKGDAAAIGWQSKLTGLWYRQGRKVASATPVQRPSAKNRTATSAKKKAPVTGLLASGGHLS